MARILGISAFYHDAAAVLIEDGRVVAAAQEERFSRVKHDAALPLRAVKWCLAQAGCAMEDIDWLVYYEKPLRKFERLLSTSVATFPRSWRAFPRQMLAWLGDKLWLRGHLVEALRVRPEKILFCEHHLAHAASAFYNSPLERAAVLCVDGVGEWATTSLWDGVGAELTPRSEIRFPHSLGLFYSAMTAFLGFMVNEGEYKVMGMAAYGQPRFAAQMESLLRLEASGGFSVDLDAFCWHYHPTESYTKKLVALLGEPRFPGAPFDIDASDATIAADSRRYADIAASVQQRLEEAMLHLTRHALAATGAADLCLAGGVALNAVANQRIAKESGARSLWIQPAAGDAGGALGAALWAWHMIEGKPRTPTDGFHPYLGRRWSSERAGKLLEELGGKPEWVGEARVARAVEELAAGKVIGWMDGAEEWGPRALGHRSILADPRTAAMAERVNVAVKHREPYRPFAPAVSPALARAAFDLAPAATAPYRWMLATPSVRPEWRERLGAVVHKDGTARVQVVEPSASPTFAALVEGFGQATGVPALLNTSFNLKGDPLVGTPVDALAALHRAELDAVYVEGWRVERRGG